MLRRGILLLAWFPLTVGLLFVNLFMLSAFSKANRASLQSAHALESTGQVTASSGTSRILSANIIPGDSRILLVESFLKKNKSPMAPYADIIVSEADRNGIDFRLVPAIAMCESNAGKRMPKKDEYNAYGIAVYTGQNHGKAFDSWPHSISWVSQYIKVKYYDRGFTDLYNIGAIWAPPSVNTGHSWSNCVQSFQDAII